MSILALSEITKYANNYKKGILDPFQYEPKERNMEEETGFMDEEEEDFISVL